MATNSMGKRVLLEMLTGRHFPHFMEPEGSLPHSQVPTTRPYSEPDQSSPYPIPLSEDPFVYYPHIYTWVFQVISFPQVSPRKPWTQPSSLPYVLRAPPCHSFWFDDRNNVYVITINNYTADRDISSLTIQRSKIRGRTRFVFVLFSALRTACKIDCVQIWDCHINFNADKIPTATMLRKRPTVLYYTYVACLLMCHYTITITRSVTTLCYITPSHRDERRHEN